MNRGSVKEIRRRNLLGLHEKHSWEHIAEKSGTNAQYLSQIANGVVQSRGKRPRSLSDDYAAKIERGLGLENGWLDIDHDVIGEPSPRYSAGYSTETENVHPGPDTRGLVPVISWVQAGHWHDAEMHDVPDDELEWRPCPISHGVRTYALRVEGDSMTAPFGKSYPAGCIIYVDPDQAGGVVSGNSVIAKINGDAKVTFKVFVEESGKRFLKPLNTQYPMITDPFRIIGKVIGTWIDE